MAVFFFWRIAVVAALEEVAEELLFGAYAKGSEFVNEFLDCCLAIGFGCGSGHFEINIK